MPRTPENECREINGEEGGLEVRPEERFPVAVIAEEMLYSMRYAVCVGIPKSG